MSDFWISVGLPLDMGDSAFLRILKFACFPGDDESDLALQLPFSNLTLDFTHFSPNNLFIDLC